MNISAVFIVLASIAYSSHGNPVNYVQDACNVTRYRDLCIHSLASFSHTAKTSPSKWARAGVSVTIGEVKGVSQYLVSLKNNNIWRGRTRLAFSDCIEFFQSALDELHSSLDILRMLSASDFYTQMSDITTYTSAALADEDTCLDGLREENGERAQLLQNCVLNATYFTSNALALINKLAETGLSSLNEP
ncbi:hypothetical protein ACFE04_020262 [Oxalis oulophora]